MRGRVLFGLMLSTGLVPMIGSASDITASVPIERAVTIYRGPVPSQDLNLDNLVGFALITETRHVQLPAGESRLRFEGVADGIEPETALISGLPVDIVEKNQDARVLSPNELVASTIGRHVVLVRTHPKTGQTTRIDGVIRSNAGDGVVFESAEGIEALRCSGVPETFRFDPQTDLGASPTLSVLVDSPTATQATITLSYLAEGFDWIAHYEATLSDDGRSIDLGAWVTLANSSAVSFPAAHTQVVAGNLNRVTPDEEGEDARVPASGYTGGTILANCWPQGTTTDLLAATTERTLNLSRALLETPAPAAAMMEIVVTAQKRTVSAEQLGDLKLYRVPETTDVQSHQMKQVRLLDRSRIPIETYYRADVYDSFPLSSPAEQWLRSKNDVKHHLGLALPAGGIDIFAHAHEASLLIGQGALRDTTVDEDLDIWLASSTTVGFNATTETTTVSKKWFSTAPPRLRGSRPHASAEVSEVRRVEIYSAKETPVSFEMVVHLDPGEELIRADLNPTGPSDQPKFKFTVPAQGAVTIRYQTARAEVKADR